MRVNRFTCYRFHGCEQRGFRLLTVARSVMAHRYKAVLIDLNGTLFVGDNAIPGSIDALAALRQHGLQASINPNPVILGQRSRMVLAQSTYSHCRIRQSGKLNQKKRTVLGSVTEGVHTDEQDWASLGGPRSLQHAHLSTWLRNTGYTEVQQVWFVLKGFGYLFASH